MTAAASAVLLSLTAHAQTAELSRVEITGTAERNYAPGDASSATRTTTPLKETPVTVQVVDKSVIADKAITGK
jgi:iron complex outermembrane receptor protein